MAVSARARFEVLKRDGFACHYCGKRAPTARLQVDHILAVSNGGADDVGNLIAACWECNIGKFTNDADYPPDDERFVLLAESEAGAIDFLKELVGGDAPGLTRLLAAPLSVVTRT